MDYKILPNFRNIKYLKRCILEMMDYGNIVYFTKDYDRHPI
jgi:hypothetical protein